MKYCKVNFKLFDETTAIRNSNKKQTNLLSLQ